MTIVMRDDVISSRSNLLSIPTPLYDPCEACDFLSLKDKRLAKIIAEVGTCTIMSRRRMTPFAALMRSIVFQQLSGKAAGTIWGRVLDACPCKGSPKPEAVLSVSYETLRAAGLSNNKALAVQDLTAKTLDGTVPGRRVLNRLPDEEIIERLTLVRGIGRWTVEMLLLFHLGRPDVFPVGDLGVRKGIAVTYGLDTVPEADELERYGDRWRPFRSVGSWYMWRALEIEVPD